MFHRTPAGAPTPGPRPPDGPDRPTGSAARRAVVCLALSAMQLTSMPVWSLDLAQRPLVADSDALPKPNLMLTLDTSGSMSFRHMPESGTKLTYSVNGVTRTVTFSTKSGVQWRHHPDDTYEGDAADYGGIMPAFKGETGTSRLEEQIKLRAPAINTIYYNPEVRYRPWVRHDGTTLGQRYADGVFTRAYINPIPAGANGTRTATERYINLADTFSLDGKRHHPAIYYLLKPNTEPGVLSNWTLHDAANDLDFPRYAGRTDCVALADRNRCSRTEEQRNFANWFVYYRTRAQVAKGALSEAFHNLDNVVRLGWTTLDHTRRNRWHDARNPIIRGVQELSPTHRRDFLRAIQTDSRFRSRYGTPLRIALDEVGRYFQRSGEDSPWADTPGSTSTDLAACRRSYNMLTTDGYYNDDPTNTQAFGGVIGSPRLVGDLDGSELGQMGTVNGYTPERPYRDRASATATGYSNTLADFALKYWVTDLSGAPNQVVASSRNPATWQHLSQFTVGMGVDGTLDRRTALTEIAAGRLEWPNPVSGDAEKIDDLWHAAVNSRGAYFSVRSAGDLQEAVRKAVGQARAESLREGAVATAGPSLQDGNIKLVPEYLTGDWTGELYAFGLDAAGRTVDGSGQPTTQPLWRASTWLNNGTPARQIRIFNPDDSQLVDFTWSAMGATNQSQLTEGSAELVDYIRGSREREGGDEGRFRSRESRLADTINSTPVLPRGGVDMGYAGETEGVDNGYAAFLARKQARQQPMAFIGSNGGMLHGFDLTSGIERFAFVPRGVLPRLHLLTAQDYGAGTGASGHRYFVDGPLAEHDGLINGQWANLLIGSLGAGGKGLFAFKLPLDTGEPELLWDLTAGWPASVAPDIGHITSRAEVGRLPNGEWKVFVGNGVASDTGQAALLMIDLASGNVQRMPVGEAGGNGLTGITLVRDAQRNVQAIFGGDLRGQMWRFDVDGADLVVGHGGRPLFMAVDSLGAPQAITAAPTVWRRRDELIVLFGTGKLLEETDRLTTQVQTLYGVTDVATASAAPAGNAAVSREQLVRQTVTRANDAGFLTLSSEAVTPAQRGWYIDLDIPAGGGAPADRPRTTFAPKLFGDFVYMSTLAPAVGGQGCEAAKGRAYDFMLPVWYGGQFNRPVFDTDGNGVVDARDANHAGLARNASGDPALLRGNRTPEGTPGSAEFSDGRIAIKGYDRPDDPPEPATPGVSDRVWQRILPPPAR